MSSLISWRGEMDRLKREMQSIFDRFLDLRSSRRFSEEEKWMPAVDLSDTSEEIIVNAEIPGVEAENIEVKLEGNVLTIKGERQREHEEKEENFHRIERSYGIFYRSLRLPSEVDAEKIKATYKKGILRIIIPKAKKEVGKKIETSPARVIHVTRHDE
jgi:HSP20 family protein